MKRIAITALLAMLLPAAVFAQEVARTAYRGAEPQKTIPIRDVTVWGRRPMKEIGTHETRLDSAVLKENIALSIADVLTFNSSIFVKSYGRATLSTVSFRGTGPSHTQVTWNGMRINNPMLGMTDFSMIPSYFIDDASLLHGSSSVNAAGGGLGGLVKLATRPSDLQGVGVQYIQGIGMFRTFDQFARFTYGGDRWRISTRIAYQTSKNDYKYRNRDKKENIYDDDRNIVGQYYPVERNRSGAFGDLHILQEAYYDTKRGDRFGASAWYVDSDREHTLRGVLSWDHLRADWKLSAKAGYIRTRLSYDYRRDKGNGEMEPMTRSRSKTNTLYAQAEGEYSLGGKWFFTADISAHQHFVASADKNIISQEGDKRVVGYDKGRIELDGSLSAKWRPTERLGMSFVLRESMFGTKWTPLIPAFFADWLLSKRGNLLAKASVSRNYRFPTLNDLYFLPGGNPDLKSESGFNYEAGLSFAVGREEVCTLSGSASWYEQYIDDWILWLATAKGFMSPVNIKKVHAYGVELEADLGVALSPQWRLGLNGTFLWAPSINEGDPVSEADLSVGKQLPYEPEYSATATGRLAWRSWGLLYQWCYYSKRYTMSSNDTTLTGYLAPYYMSNVSIEKGFSFAWSDLTLKATVNNLFNEEYLSVLGRPMPRMNAEFFIGIRPKWGKRRNAARHK